MLQIDIDEMVSSSDSDLRKKAAMLLEMNFKRIDDKESAWKNLIVLVNDDDSGVREKASHALRSVLKRVPNKDMVWKDLILLTNHPDRKVREGVINGLNIVFIGLNEKFSAIEDLHRLTDDQRSEVRAGAADTLKIAFQYVQDKNRAWDDLHRLTSDESSKVRAEATNALKSAFKYIPDKNRAWDDLHRLTRDQNKKVRFEAASTLSSAFRHIPDKNTGWRDLISWIDSDNGYDQIWVEYLLRSAYPYVPDKINAWEDLHRLNSDPNMEVRVGAINALGSVYGHIPYKEKQIAWDDLIRSFRDPDGEIRWTAANALKLAFPQNPNKSKAWADLMGLTNATDGYVQMKAADLLRWAYSYIPDKDKWTAWQDLIKLISHEDNEVRWMAAYSIPSAFQCIPEKGKVWTDLIKLINNPEDNVREPAADAIGKAFQYVPDKNNAWKDLHKLANDQNSCIRERIADALGSSFRYIPDINATLDDLHKLTHDNVSFVRCTAYHSLGKISILKATEDDNEFRSNLEDAIVFFRRSSEEAEYFNPAAFCLPFYLSLHCLLFADLPKEDEVQKYLFEAERAIESSESKEVLLEAVINLSKALREVRAYSIEDIALRKRDLKSYTKYCLRSAECLREARSKVPLASKIVDYTLVEKSIPIVDQKIKSLFRDVETTARELCENTRGTYLETLGRDAYKSTKGLNKVESWIVADRYLEEIVPLLKGHCNRLPKEAQAYLKILIASQDSASLEQRFDTLKSILLASLVQRENDNRIVNELKGLLDLHLQNIEFAILNLNTSSGNARKDLYSLKNQINGLQREIESKGLAKKQLAEALDERDQAMIERLEKMREKMLRAVRETAQLNASKRDVETILKELDDQDKLKKRDVLGIIADLSSLAGMALSIPPGAPRAAMNLAARLLE